MPRRLASGVAAIPPSDACRPPGKALEGEAGSVRDALRQTRAAGCEAAYLSDSWWAFGRRRQAPALRCPHKRLYWIDEAAAACT